MPRVPAPKRAPLAFELEEVGENRLARDLQQTVLEPTIDQRDEYIGRGVPHAQRVQNLLFTLVTVLEVRLQHGVRIFDHWTMRREQPRRLKRPHPLER